MKSGFKNLCPSPRDCLINRVNVDKKHTRMGVKGENYPDPEGSRKATIYINYRLITCLLMLWKALTAHIREEIYYSYSLLYATDYFQKN